MNLTEKQKGVIRGVIPAAASDIVGMCGLSLLIPMSALPADDAAARIAWALQWALLPVLTLVISIMLVANHRFSSPEDIDGSGLTLGTGRVLVLWAVLQNTLEQALLSLTAYLIWATAMPHAWLRAIRVAASLFVGGRISYARGYEHGAAGRAKGFGLTAYPTFGMLAVLVVVLLFRFFAWVAG